jgi:O-antigen/teichoic acid export membrane protein
MSAETPVQAEPPVDEAAAPEGTPAAGPPPEPTAGLRRKAVRGGLVLMATRLLTQVFLWAVTLVVARLLLPYDYGLMTTGFIFVTLADLLAEAGVGKALIQKKDLSSEDIAEGFTLNLLLAGGLYGLLFALAGPASLWLGTPEFTEFLRVLGLLLLLTPFRAIPAALLDRELRMGKQSLVHLLTALAQAALVLGLALADFGYWALAGGAMAARVMEVAALVWIADWRPRLRLPGTRARGLLAFGVHVSLGSLLWFVYSNSDYAIVGRLAGPIALGYYALAFQLISLPVQKLTANVNQVAYPVFCRLQHDRPRLRNWYLRLTVLLGFFGTPALAGMALVADDAFAVLLGDQWLPAVLPFRLLAGAGILMIFSHSLPPLLNALGRPDINFKYTLACTLVFPACFVAAGLLDGLTGICLAWLTVYPVLVTTLLWFTRGVTGVGPLALLRAQVPVLGAVAFMTAIVLLVQWAVGASVPAGARLAAAIVVGAVAYAGWMLVAGRRTVVADLRALLRELKGQAAPA